ncbi:hypothetical protein GCM10025864_24400 [Luteimicrobium album]|uniref:Uncharacterized protein n=1 Tax=Luteimicrobium album TaxID=1054550 RepID=A0ABQ6I1W0_9MICO|nr:hypothetical protein [Luteimicrobium album]GMA24681.1 hypothetical protein GCM10025864_24400 [Luteimicrobium album]
MLSTHETETVAAQGRSVQARQLAEKIRLSAERTYGASRPEIRGLLEGWMISNYELLIEATEPANVYKVHPGQLNYSDVRRRAFERASGRLVDRPQDLSWYSDEWFTLFAFTPDAYQRLIDATGPGLKAPKGTSFYAIARQVGGVPRLVASAQEAHEAADAARSRGYHDDASTDVDRILAEAQAKGWATVANT